MFKGGKQFVNSFVYYININAYVPMFLTIKHLKIN